MNAESAAAAFVEGFGCAMFWSLTVLEQIAADRSAPRRLRRRARRALVEHEAWARMSPLHIEA